MTRAPIKTLPDQGELQRLFDYDPETGVLRWKYVRPRAYRISVGDEAGTVTDRGYLAIGIERRYYLAHRVIWKMNTDGDRLNNRWANLREATNGQNRHNIGLQKNNSSGVKGVCWVASHNAWAAYISTGGKQQRLGRFKSLNKAIDVRREAESRLHGAFARAA